MPSLQKNFTTKINAIINRKWPRRVIHARIPQPVDFSKLEKVPEYYRIYICLEGESLVTVPVKSGTKLVTIKSGDAIIVYPNCWIFGMSSKSSPHYNNLGIRIFPDGYKFSEMDSESWPFLSSNLNFPLPESSIYLKKTRDLLDLLSFDEFAEDEVQSAHLISTLFFLIYKSLSQKVDFSMLSKKQANTLRLQELTYYIEHNFNNALNRKDLAKQFNLPESTIANYFKHELNTTFRQYVSSQKMKEAVKLLVNTKLNISEISKVTGYSHLESFTLAFENNFDCPPSTFRKAYDNNNRKSSQQVLQKLESYSLLPLLSLEELQKNLEKKSDGHKITVPFRNKANETVDLFEVQQSGAHEIRGRATPDELIFIKAMSNATLLVKTVGGKTLGGYIVSPQSSGILFQ